MCTDAVRFGTIGAIRVQRLYSLELEVELELEFRQSYPLLRNARVNHSQLQPGSQRRLGGLQGPRSRD